MLLYNVTWLLCIKKVLGSYGVCMFSMFTHGFSLGTLGFVNLVSSQSQKP